MFDLFFCIYLHSVFFFFLILKASFVPIFIKCGRWNRYFLTTKLAILEGTVLEHNMNNQQSPSCSIPIPATQAASTKSLLPKSQHSMIKSNSPIDMQQLVLFSILLFQRDTVFLHMINSGGCKVHLQLKCKVTERDIEMMLGSPTLWCMHGHLRTI